MTIYDDSGNCQSNFYYEATTDCWVTFSIEAIRIVYTFRTYETAAWQMISLDIQTGQVALFYVVLSSCPPS